MHWSRKAIFSCLITLFMISGLLTNQAVHAAEQGNNQGHYELYPNPQQITYGNSEMDLGTDVNIIFESTLDQATKNRLTDVLGTHQIGATESAELVEGKTNILVGTVDSGEYVDTYFDDVQYDADLFSQIDAYVLSIQNNTIAILGKDTDAAYYGITTLKHILDQAEGNTLQQLQINDYSTTEQRGFIEGYYGIPWSEEDRISLMEFGSDFKMNNYIFAPKDDEYHQTQWRKLVMEEDLENTFKPLVEAGVRTKNRFVFAIHPFMSNRIGDVTAAEQESGKTKEEKYDEDIALIIEKFEQLYDVGVRQFALLADDAVSDLQIRIDVMNDLNEWLKTKEGTYPLIYVPQHYSGYPSHDVFGKINDEVADDIIVMYTGSAIIGNVDKQTNENFYNAFITEKSKEGKYPYIWLNWPVNDYTDSTLFIGKAEMLEKGTDNLVGVSSNPMQEAELSKIGLFQVADYSWNTHDFDVDMSWKDSFGYVDHGIADELEVLAKHMSYPRDGVYHQTGLAWEESEEIAPLLTEFKEKVAAGEDIEALSKQLLEEFQIILDAIENVPEKSNNAELVKEFAPYLESLEATVKANQTLVQAAQALFSDDLDGAWNEYSKSIVHIEESNAVTKPGLKPGGPTNLEVKPATKYLRPFARDVQTLLDKLIQEKVGADTGEYKAIGQFQEWNPSQEQLNNLIDNNENTKIELTGGQQRAGDYFGVDLGKVKEVSKVEIVQGSHDNDHDYFHYAVLEISEDGEDWEVLKDFSKEANEAGMKTRETVEEKAMARYVRLRLTEQGFNGKPDYWFNAREFMVEAADKPFIISNKENIAQHVSIDIREGQYEINILGDIAFARNEYVGFDFTKVIKLGNLAALEANGLTVQYSNNGKDWKSVTDTDVEVTARYVRFINFTRDMITLEKGSFLLQMLDPRPIEASTTGTIESGDIQHVIDHDRSTSVLITGGDVTIDIGQSIDLEKLTIIVGEGTKDEEIMQEGTIEVSKDGNEWITVKDYVVDGKGISQNGFTRHEAPYYMMDIAVEDGKNIRYVRVTETKNSQFRLNEIEFNNGQIISTDTNYDVETNLIFDEANPIAHLIDGKMDTFFTVKPEGEAGYVKYTLTDDANYESLTIVQNAETISNAGVFFIDGKGEKHTLGKLDKSMNYFSLENTNARSIVVEWTADTIDFKLHEFFTKSHETNNVVAEKSALATLIGQANGLESDDYTEESWEAFTTVLKQAESVLVNEDATQEVVDEAFDTLEQAMDALDEDSLDLSELEELIKEVKSITNDDGKYTVDSFGALVEAIEVAESALETIETEEELSASIAALNAALEGLVESVDLATLESLIKEAQAITNEEGKYTEDSFRALVEAIEAAESTLETIETEEELAEALEALQSAIDGLKEVEEDNAVDVSGLEALIAEAKAILNDDGTFTDASFAVLQEAIETAETALEMIETKEELAEAVNALQSAIDGLEKVTEGDAVDVSELEALIAEAKVISNNDGTFTDASFATLQEAIEEAEAALETIETEEQLEVALEVLQMAIDSLEEEAEPIDVSSLAALIEEAQAITNEDGTYTEESFVALQEAIVLAQSALGAIKTDEQLVEALEALQLAIESLEEGTEPIDVSSLAALIEEAQAITNENGRYTEESFVALQEAIVLAQSALETIETEEELTKAIASLQTAIEELEEVVGDEEVIDVSALESLIDEALAITNDGKYTEESFEALQSAIETAQLVLETIETEEALAEAIETLQKAIDGLEKQKDSGIVEKPTQPNPEPKPNPSKDDGTGQFEGNKLPTTATTMYTWLFAGILLLVLGTVVSLFVRRKKHS